MLQHMGVEMTRLANGQDKWGHRTEKLEFAAERAAGAAEVQAKWHIAQVEEVKKTLEKKDRHDAQRITWLFMGAGLLSTGAYTFLDRVILVAL